MPVKAGKDSVVYGGRDASIYAYLNSSVYVSENAEVRAIGNADIHAIGEAKAIVSENAVLHLEGNATGMAAQNARVYARQNARAVLTGNAVGEFIEEATGVIKGNASGTARDGCKLEVKEQGTLEAFDNADITAGDFSKSDARNNVTITLNQNASCTAHNNAKVILRDNAQAMTFDNVEVDMSGKARVDFYNVGGSLRADGESTVNIKAPKDENGQQLTAADPVPKISIVGKAVANVERTVDFSSMSLTSIVFTNRPVEPKLNGLAVIEKKNNTPENFDKNWKLICKTGQFANKPYDAARLLVQNTNYDMKGKMELLVQKRGIRDEASAKREFNRVNQPKQSAGMER